jgi:hypothetical protein
MKKDIEKNSELEEHYQQVEESLDNIKNTVVEVLCGAGEIRRDRGDENPRCEECVCQN